MFESSNVSRDYVSREIGRMSFCLEQNSASNKNLLESNPRIARFARRLLCYLAVQRERERDREKGERKKDEEGKNDGERERER